LRLAGRKNGNPAGFSKGNKMTNQPKIVRAFSICGPCLTLGRLTKETAQFYCFDEWRGGDSYSGAKRVAKERQRDYSAEDMNY
jgi:hypothetical protein